MDVAVTSAHGAEGRAEVSAHAIENWFTEGEPAGPVANQRSENVAFAQGQPRGHAESFLAAADKNPAVHFPHAVQAGEFFVQ
jgi:hypothetical protein